MSKEFTVGEWQLDQWGKRFRMIGNTKEYETMVRVDGGVEIPISQLAEYNERVKESRQREIEQPVEKAAFCPLSSGLDKRCKSNCALYNNGCALSHIRECGTVDTANKPCPLTNYGCTADCVMYKNGCVITAIGG